MSRCKESSVCRNPILASQAGLVSVPKFPPIPRLSIVIPIGRDLTAFESTLISVLENPVAGAEILVCHDGSYDDPFSLADEVRFVVAESHNPLHLIAAGASESRGRFVHVISDGIRATNGWTDDALDAFEAYDCGVVAPVIRNEKTGRIVAAGWNDGTARLCESGSHGLSEVKNSNKEQAGAYLSASFWRRELLRSLTDAFTSADVLEASYAFQYLAANAGWHYSIAEGSELLIEASTLTFNQPSLTRGQQTQGIKNYFARSGWTHSLLDALRGGIASLTRPGQIPELIGRSLAPTAQDALSKRLRPTQVAACDQHETIVSMPKGTRSLDLRRRAA